MCMHSVLLFIIMQVYFQVHNICMLVAMMGILYIRTLQLHSNRCCIHVLHVRNFISMHIETLVPSTSTVVSGSNVKRSWTEKLATTSDLRALEDRMESRFRTQESLLQQSFQELNDGIGQLTAAIHSQQLIPAQRYDKLNTYSCIEHSTPLLSTIYISTYIHKYMYTYVKDA